MKTLILASLLLTQTGPNWMNGDPKAVPEVILPTMCVEAHRTEKGKKAGGEYKINIFSPPLDKEAIRLLQEGRKRGLVTLRQCSAANS